MYCDRYIKEEHDHKIYMRTRLVHLQTTGRTIKRVPRYGVNLGDPCTYSFDISVDNKLKTQAKDILSRLSKQSHYKPTIQETNDLADLGFTQFTALMDLTEDEINQVLTAPGDHKTKQRLRTKIKQIRRELKSVKALGLFNEGVPLCKLANWQWKVLDEIAKDSWKNGYADSPEELSKYMAHEIGKREALGGPCNSIACRRSTRMEEAQTDRKLAKILRENPVRNAYEDFQGIEDAKYDLFLDQQESTINYESDSDADYDFCLDIYEQQTHKSTLIY